MKYKITGSNVINGTIDISGSKNACLPIIVASLLTKEKVVLENVPLIVDVVNLIRLLDNIGVDIEYEYLNRRLIINAKKVKTKIDSIYVKKLRASYYLMGALLSRKKEIEINYPGGCTFSSRPIDIHLYVFESLGVKIENKELLKLKVDTLTPKTIDFPLVTVGGTINTILLMTLSKGITILNNASIEPEVIDVINFLNQCGGDITVNKTTIKINGVKKLHGTTYKIMPDRIEAGSYLLLASSIKNSEITLNKVRPSDLESVIDTLKKLNNEIEINETSITLKSKELSSIDIETGPYPKFPTDLQPLLSTILLNGSNKSMITDTIYPDRISHIEELQKMNGDIIYENNQIIINPSKLENSNLIVKDLRCGFSLIIASNMAKGISTLNKVEYISRGYEDIFKKLKQLGINCQKEL